MLYKIQKGYDTFFTSTARPTNNIYIAMWKNGLVAILDFQIFLTNLENVS
jgi:hypothetical protein